MSSNFSIKKDLLPRLCSFKTVELNDNPSAFIKVAWPAEDSSQRTYLVNCLQLSA